MHDQAARLRQLVNENQQQKKARVITVTSGKGGVGKSNFTINFALGLRDLGKKVVILDADFGLANLDVLLGISVKSTLSNLIYDRKTIWDVLYKSEFGIDLVAGGSGVRDLLSLEEGQLQYFLNQIDLLNQYADYIIIDTGAGLSKETARFMIAADEVILVTTPEPTSITDAYAIIKMVHATAQNIHYKLVINRAVNDMEGKATVDKLQLVSKRFLNIDLSALGYLPDDVHVQNAVKKQQPFYLLYPNSEVTKSMKHIVNQYLEVKTTKETSHGISGFINKMLKLLK